MTQPSELDAETKARIRAEEIERAKVRAELAVESRLSNPPNFWAGVLLNILITGAGLMSIGRWAAGLLWLVGTVALGFLVGPMFAWPVGIVGSLIHYENVYDTLYSTATEQEQGRKTMRTWYIAVGLLLALSFLTIQFMRR